MSDQKQVQTRDTGCYLIVYRDSDGKPAVIERGTKREAVKTLEAIGIENIAAFYKNARRIEIKVKQRYDFD